MLFFSPVYTFAWSILLAADLNSLIIAGSETTATALSGCAYYLCKNRHVLDRLCEEVRSNFESSSEITSSRCFALPYLIAVIEETLRVYPPVVTQVPRVVPKGGATVEGHFLPEDVCTSLLELCLNSKLIRTLRRLLWLFRIMRRICPSLTSPVQRNSSLSDG